MFKNKKIKSSNVNRNPNTLKYLFKTTHYFCNTQPLIIFADIVFTYNKKNARKIRFHNEIKIN